MIDYDILSKFLLGYEIYINKAQNKLEVKVNKDQDVENKRKEALQVILNIDDVRRFSGGEFEVDESIFHVN